LEAIFRYDLKTFALFFLPGLYLTPRLIYRSRENDALKVEEFGGY